jgi:ribosomal protein L7/L12
MSLVSKTLIAATVQITKMDRDRLQTVLLEILANNPSTILKLLDVNPTYRIVLDGFCDSKLDIIKAFRFVTNAGLVDSKNWCEGGEYDGCPAGTFKKGLTLAEAQHIAKTVNDAINEPDPYRNLKIKVKVIKDDDHYFYPEHINWATGRPA